MLDRVVDETNKLLIDGHRVGALSGRSFETVNPATGEVLARVAEAGVEDVDEAVRSSRQAFEGVWSDMRGSERGALLRSLADLIRRDADELVRLESLDSGKPVSAIRRQDLPAVLDTLVYYAGMADRINGEVIPTRSDALTYTMREPVGVVGAIVPWNFPLMIGMWKVAPALACGCTVVLKPAEVTPLTALKIGELALEAGFPAGVLNVVPGFGKVAGQALVDHPDVDKITFTGSPIVGRQILQGAAGNLKRVTLELGGKSANIVFADADIEAAVKAAASGIFFNSGQVCSAGSRILVQESVYDEVVERLSARAKAIRLGDPLDVSTAMGPVVSDVQMQRVLNYIEIGRKEGARVVAGGVRRSDIGYFVEPTVFAGVRPEMRISQEEIFGPVAAVIPFKDDEGAIRILTMIDKPKSEAFSRGQEIWSALSASEQTGARMLLELKREGFRVSQATVFRWAKEWRHVVHAAVNMLAVEPPSDAGDEVSREIATSIDVPADLKDILPARLLPVAKGGGADAIESAIRAISEAVRSRADEIVESGDKNRMRTCVSALSVLSVAIERIAAARSTTSVAHRSYCEGDRLLAEGERLRAEARKFDAEAEVAMCGVRALNAKDVSGQVQVYEDSNAAQTAREILRGMVNPKTS